MAAIDYVIVGAEVDETTHYLRNGDTVTTIAGPQDVPLNVEYIGNLMVRLSQLGKDAVSAADLVRYQNIVKHALRIRTLGGAGGGQLSAAEEAAILNDTTVTITFETRESEAGTADRNTRILVVPSDSTLKIAEAAYQAGTVPKGFRPPLTYDLDRALMLASLEGTIQDIIATFSTQPGSTPQLQEALRVYVAAEIARRTTFADGPGGSADSVLNEIMQSPLRAFHRSVGIYATNMCR